MRFRGLARLTWTELKLFFREPISLIFSFAFPLMILVILLGVFGDQEGDVTFYGASGTDFYVPAYIGTVVAAVALVSLPVHLAGYVERGVLRRLRASGVRGWTVLAAQGAVATVSIVLGAALVVALGAATYDLSPPDDVAIVLLGFVLGTLAFLALGGLLAMLARTARAAQAIGLLLFFGPFFISGAGPPRTVLPDWLVTAGDWLPLTSLVSALQDPWIGRAFDATPYLVLGGIAIVAGTAAALLIRRG